MIPNLVAASRAAINNVKNNPSHRPIYPTDPPPPYTPHSEYSPPAAEKPKVSIPLIVQLLSPSSGQSPNRVIRYTHSENVDLGPGTDYWEFLNILRPILASLAVGLEWDVAIAAEIRERMIWRSRRRRDLDVVGEKDWQDVIRELEVDRVRGLRIQCWRR